MRTLPGREQDTPRAPQISKRPRSVKTTANYFLTTARLGFRRRSATDSERALLLWGDLQVTQIIGGLYTKAQIDARLARVSASMDEYGNQYWPLFLLADSEFARFCSLRPF